MLARLSLGVTAAAFTGFGAWLLSNPREMSRVDVQLPTPTARAEVRAFYGGLELGLGLFFAAAAVRTAWHRPALVAQTAALGGAALARVVSMRIDPPVGSLVGLLAVLEATAAVGGAVALSRTTAQRDHSPDV